MVKVVALDQAEQKQIKRLGFMQGEFLVPDDFDQMEADEINRLLWRSCF